MAQFLSAVTLLVDDYDQAISFYTEKLNFELIEDTLLSPEKRWVLVAPKGAGGASTQTRILLAKASNAEQTDRIGNQTGDRVAFFLKTDDFDNDYRKMVDAGVAFLERPRSEIYGRVVVFTDPFGNKWDLLEG